MLPLIKKIQKFFINVLNYNHDKKSTDYAFADQVESSFERVLENNFRASIFFKIIISLSIILYGILDVMRTEASDIRNLYILYGIVFGYGIVNVFVLIKSELFRKHLTLLGFIVPIFEALMITGLIIMFNNKNDIMFFFGEDDVLFALIIVVSSLYNNRVQVIINSSFIALWHLCLNLYFYPTFLKGYSHIDLKSIVNYQEFIWYFMNFILIGAILAFKTRESFSIATDVRNIWIPKIVGGAYKDIVQPNIGFERGRYSIVSSTSSPDKFVGSDYVQIYNIGNDISILVGDIVSHGINVSQGALISITAYLCGTKNPRHVLKRINNILYPINREHGGETFAIALILKPNGKMIYNGILDDFYVIRRNGIKVNVPTDGVMLGKDSDYKVPKNKEFQLRSGDQVYIKTDGAAHNDEEDDKTEINIEFI